MATGNNIKNFIADGSLADGIYLAAAQMTSGKMNTGTFTTELAIKSSEGIYGTYLGNIGTPNGLSSQLWDSSNSASAGTFGTGWFRSTAIGNGLGTVVSASDSVLIGTPGEGFSNIGGSALVTNSVYIGEGSGHRAASLTIDASIAIGYQARVDASNQLVFGGNSSRIYDVYFGPTIGAAASTATTIQPGGGSGTNKTGVNFQIAAGKGTGNSTSGGSIIFQTPDATSSGATLQSLTTKATLSRAGLFGVGASTTPTSTLHSFGSFSASYVAKTTTYTVTISDYTVNCDGTFNVTLPTAVGVTGRIYNIKNSGTGTVTIATTSSQTIDGTTTKTLSVQYNSYTVQSDGANWIVL